MIFGVILAGGTGTRMNVADMPKQFLPLGDKPIIIYSLETYLACERLDCIYIGVHKDWVEHTKELIEKYVPDQKDRIRVLVGGSDRNGTVENAINAIEQDWGESPEHVMITQDSVRPFTTLRMVEENVDYVLAYGAVNTVVPAVDTILLSDDGKLISEVPDRSRIYQGQSPQSFCIQTWKELYASMSDEEKAILTDGSKIFVTRDHPVYLIKGAANNFKITTPADYEMARAIVEIRSREE